MNYGLSVQAPLSLSHHQTNYNDHSPVILMLAYSMFCKQGVFMPMQRRVLVALFVALFSTTIVFTVVQAQRQERCFPETGFCISGRIRTFWERNGGLSVFGFPLGPQQAEDIEGQSYQVQWFERNRLELHPENVAPQDVLLGRLGADSLAHTKRDWQDFPKSEAKKGCRRFPETGHSICGAFLARWQANGVELDHQPGISEAESIALFGLPLSDPRPEQIAGQTYTIQWFERARFEMHPELGSTRVLLGLLGTDLQAVSPSTKTSVVDRTEDYETVGFPDQRKIVRDKRGNLYVAYRKKVENVYHIFVARSANGGASWSVLNDNQPIESVGSYNQRNPAIAIDADDTLHVTWYGNDARHTDNDRQIKYVQSRDGGGTWSQWRNVADVPGYRGQDRWQEHPALSTQGTAVTIVWEGFDQSSPQEEQIKLTRSTDGGQTWTPWQTIVPSPRDGLSRPTVVTSNDGRRLYVLAYQQHNNSRRIVWTRSDDGGTTWTPWGDVAPSTADQRHVSLAMDSTGHLHAVWRQQFGGDATQIVYATSDGSTWSTPVAVSPSSAFQLFPSIAVSSQNTLHVVWTETPDDVGYPQDDPKTGQIVGVSRAAGQDWSRPTVINPPGQSAIYASLRWGSVLNNGNIDVIWMDTTDPKNRYIRHTTLGH
jgi:hypothetical protein